MGNVIIGAALLTLLGAGDVVAADANCDMPERPRSIMSTHTVAPYPKASLEAFEEGNVLAEVAIGTGGAPTDVQLLVSSGYPNLDAGVLAHLKAKWLWEPEPSGCPARRARVQVTMDLRDAGVQAPPRVIKLLMTDGDFPPGAGRAARGTTSIAVSLGGPGVLKKIHLLKSSGYAELDYQSQSFARDRYKFDAGQMDGKPVYTLFQLDFVWPDRRK